VVRPQEAGSVVITDSLLDWIDPDRFERPNGAEDLFYSAADRPYTARNYALQYKEELGFIRGMDPELYRKVSPYVTLLPNLGFNPNTASDEVLMAYLAIDNGAVKKLRDYMAQGPVLSDTALFALTGRTIAGSTEGIYFHPVKSLEVTVSSGKPRPYYTIRAGVDLRQNAVSPYNVVYWNEE
jgi:general secretion pathway protein K